MRTTDRRDTNWIKVLALLAASVLPSSLSQPARATDAPKTPGKYEIEYARERGSKELCEALPGRIFAKTEQGAECIAYFVTKGQEDQRQAVLFFDGDVNLEKYLKPHERAVYFKGIKKALQSWADVFKVRYVFVSRVGVNGSSGNHGDRRSANESRVMNVFIDELKQSLRLERLVLAGQSGGSTISASLLTFGRTDVGCAILGSGAYEVNEMLMDMNAERGVKVSRKALERYTYDPSVHVETIKKDSARRVLFLGDPEDTKTPFEQQVRFAEAVRGAGHHAGFIRIDAKDEHNHGATRYVFIAAGLCAKGATDTEISAAMKSKVPAKSVQTSALKSQTPSAK